jgi:hypothetical protein
MELLVLGFTPISLSCGRIAAHLVSIATRVVSIATHVVSIATPVATIVAAGGCHYVYSFSSGNTLEDYNP